VSKIGDLQDQLRADLQITVAEAATLMSRLIPILLLDSLRDDAEDRFNIKQRRLVGGMAIGALAANFSQVTIFNTAPIDPAAAVLSIVEYCTYSQSLTANWDIQQIFATTNLVLTASNVRHLDLQWTPTASVISPRTTMRGGQNVAIQGASISGSNSSGILLAATPVEILRGAVLSPQTGFAVGPTSTNITAALYAQFREVEVSTRRA